LKYVVKVFYTTLYKFFFLYKILAWNRMWSSILPKFVEEPASQFDVRNLCKFFIPVSCMNVICCENESNALRVLISSPVCTYLWNWTTDFCGTFNFRADLWNVPDSAEFLCFRRMLRNSILAGDKGTNMA